MEFETLSCIKMSLATSSKLMSFCVLHLRRLEVGFTDICRTMTVAKDTAEPEHNQYADRKCCSFMVGFPAKGWATQTGNHSCVFRSTVEERIRKKDKQTLARERGKRKIHFLLIFLQHCFYNYHKHRPTVRWSAPSQLSAKRIATTTSLLVRKRN